MPIFEYACSSCGNQFEHLQRADAQQPPCPECGRPEVVRKLSAFAPLSGGRSDAAPAESPCGACGNPFGSCAAMGASGRA
jgi:putative FmdB family regulatory protein